MRFQNSFSLRNNFFQIVCSYHVQVGVVEECLFTKQLQHNVYWEYFSYKLELLFWSLDSQERSSVGHLIVKTGKKLWFNEGYFWESQLDILQLLQVMF